MSESSSPIWVQENQPFESNSQSHSHSHSLSEAFTPRPIAHWRSASNPRPLPTPPGATQPQPWTHNLSQQPPQPLASAHPVRRLPQGSKPINWARPLRSQPSIAESLNVDTGGSSRPIIFGESSQRKKRLQRSPQTPSVPSATPDFGSPTSPGFPVTPSTPDMSSFGETGAYSSWLVDRPATKGGGLGLGELGWDRSALADYMDEDDHYGRHPVHAIEPEQPNLPSADAYSPQSDEAPSTPPERIAPPLPLPSAPKVAGKKVATVTRDSVGSLTSLAGISAIAAPTPVDARLSLLSRRGHSVLLPSPQTSPRAHASPLLPPSPDSESSSGATSASGATNTSASALGRTASQRERKIRRKAVPILGEAVKMGSPATSPALTSTSCASPSLPALSPTSSALASPTSPISPMMFTEMPPKTMHVLETIAPPPDTVSRSPSVPTTPRKTKHEARSRSQSDIEVETDRTSVTRIGADGLADQMESSLNLHLREEGWEIRKDRRKEDGKRGHKFSKLFRRQVEA